MTTYEVISEPYEECVEHFEGYPRYETTVFYELIEAESRSKARYKAFKKLGISDFRDAPKLSIRKHRPEAAEVGLLQELEEADKEVCSLQEKVAKLTDTLSTYEHRANYYEQKYLALVSKLNRLIPHRMIRELLGLT